MQIHEKTGQNRRFWALSENFLTNFFLFSVRAHLQSFYIFAPVTLFENFRGVC